MKFKIRINPVAIADVQEIKAYIVSVYRVLNGMRNYLSILFTDELPENLLAP